jgi:hypothetical protein
MSLSHVKLIPRGDEPAHIALVMEAETESLVDGAQARAVSGFGEDRRNYVDLLRIRGDDCRGHNWSTLIGRMVRFYCGRLATAGESVRGADPTGLHFGIMHQTVSYMELPASVRNCSGI